MALDYNYDLFDTKSLGKKVASITTLYLGQSGINFITMFLLLHLQKGTTIKSWDGQYSLSSDFLKNWWFWKLMVFL